MKKDDEEGFIKIPVEDFFNFYESSLLLDVLFEHGVKDWPGFEKAYAEFERIVEESQDEESVDSEECSDCSNCSGCGKKDEMN